MEERSNTSDTRIILCLSCVFVTGVNASNTGMLADIASTPTEEFSYKTGSSSGLNNLVNKIIDEACQKGKYGRG